MLNLLNIFFVLAYSMMFIIEPCISKCETVRSEKYGKLSLKRSEKTNLHFIGNLIFESKESGKILCLDKNITEETEELTFKRSSKKNK